MITGATRGKGGYYLERHLADKKKQNDATINGDSRGLVSVGIQAQVRELKGLSSHARTAKPLYHIHVDPSINYTSEQWSDYWKDFEKEFNLQNQPFAEVLHVKHGREHKHRVYSLVLPNGNTLKMDNDFSRREKLSRLAEIKNNENITKGRHNRAVISALEAEGLQKEADILKAAGIQNSEKPTAKLKPNERSQQERTEINKAILSKFIFHHWNPNEPESFRKALKNKGCHLAIGDKGAVVIDPSGNVHAVNRLLNMASKEAGKPLKLKAKEVLEILKPLNLSTYIKEKAENEQQFKSRNQKQRARNKNKSISKDIYRSESSEHKSNRNFGEIRETGNRNRPDSRDQGSAGNYDQQSKRNYQNAIALAKIRSNNFSELKKSISYYKIIDSDYLKEMKSKLNDYSHIEKNYYYEYYRNLKEQEYYLNLEINSFNNDALLMMIDFFMRLFFGVSISPENNRQIPIIEKPKIENPLSNKELLKLDKAEIKKIAYATLQKYRASHKRFNSLCDLLKCDNQKMNFEDFFNSIGNDFLKEEIINLFPSIYLFELSVSDKKMAALLKDKIKDEKIIFPGDSGVFKFLENLRKDIENHLIDEKNKEILEAQKNIFPEYKGEENQQSSRFKI